MKRLLFIFTLAFFNSFNLFSQFFPPAIPSVDYGTFINEYINSTGIYKDIPESALEILINSKQMNKLFDDGIKTFTFGELITIAQNPEKILDTTTNESVILLVGTTLAFLELANMQQGSATLVINALKKKTAFNAASGNNTGLLIPMYTPIGSFGINLYSDVPLYSAEKIKKSTQNDYESLSKSLDLLPIPHINAYLQVNL